MLPYGLACLLVIYCNYTDLSTEWQNVQYPEMLHKTSKCPLVVHRTKENPSPVCSQTKLLDHSGRCMNSNRTDILGLVKRSCPEKRGRLFTLVWLLSSSVKIRTGSEPQSAKKILPRDRISTFHKRSRPLLWPAQAQTGQTGWLTLWERTSAGSGGL